MLQTSQSNSLAITGTCGHGYRTLNLLFQQPRVMIVIVCVCFLLTADSALMLILRIIKQEVKNKRK